MRPTSTRPNVLPIVAAGLLVTTTGCRAIADIFKAGMWVGVVIAVLVVALIGGIAAAFRR